MRVGPLRDAEPVGEFYWMRLLAFRRYGRALTELRRSMVATSYQEGRITYQHIVLTLREGIL